MSRLTEFPVARISFLAFILTIGATNLAGCDRLFGLSAEEHFQRAQQYQSEGNIPAAVIELKNTLQQDPGNGEARLALGQIYLESGDHAGATKELMRARELGIVEARVREPLVEAMLLGRQYRSVLDELAKVPVAERSAVLLTYAGNAHLALGEREQAQESFATARRLDASLPGPHIGMAQLAWQSGHPAEARSHLDRAIQADPASVHAWLLKGEFEFGAKDIAAAQVSFQQALEHSGSNDVLARFGLTRVLLAQRKPEAALEHINALKQKAPQNPTTNYLAALAAYQQGDLQAAEDAVRQALKVVPDHPQALLLMGTLQYRHGNYEQAEEAVVTFLAAKPNYVPARQLLANVRLARDQVDGAIDALLPAAESSPTDPRLLAQLGTAYMRSGEPARASELLAEAARLAPDSAPVRTQLALSHLAVGATSKAIAELDAIKAQGSAFGPADTLLVLTHLRAQDFDEALAEARNLAAKNPDSPVAHNLAAAAYLGKGEAGAARNEFEKALQLRPDFAPALFNLAQLDLREGKADAARQRYEQVLGNDENNVKALVGLSELEIKADRGEKALSLLEQAREHNPGAIEPRFILGDFALRTGRPEEALALATEAVRSHSADPRALSLLGKAQLALGKSDQAMASLRKAVELRPNLAELHYQLAFAEERADQVDQARASYRRALALTDDSHLASLVALARLEARTGNRDEAEKLSRQLKARHPKSPAGYIVEGDLFAETGNDADAARAYEGAQALGESTEAALKLHAALIRHGDSAAATAYLESWLERHPGDLRARLVLASFHQKSGNRKQAAGHYERILQASPDNAAALNNLAWLYAEAHDNRAEELARRAHEAAPDDPAIMDTYGWLQVQSGKVEGGLPLLRQAAARLSGAPEVSYHLGAALLQLGQTSQARTYLQRAVETPRPFDGKEDAKQLLSGLQER